MDIARRFCINGMIFLIVFGALLSVACYAGAGFLAADVLHRVDLAPLVRYVSIVVLAQTLLQSSIAGLVGWNSMGLASLASVLQAALRLCISPLLVLSGLGVSGALTGFAASNLLAGGVAGLAFYALRLTGAAAGVGVGSFLSDVKEMVSYGMPVYLGILVTGLASYFVTILVAAIASNSVVGYYQAALNVTVAISLSSSAIITALFPAFSSLHGVGADTSLAFRHATKYVAYLMAPAVLFLVGSSGLVVTLLYGSAFYPAGGYLALLSLSNLPLVIGLSGVFFNGIGRTRLSLWVSLVAAASLFLLAPVLGMLSSLAVDGLIYATLASYALSSVFGLYLSWRYLRATVDMKSIAAILCASVLGTFALRLTFLVSLPGLVALALGALAFFLVYLTAAPLLGAIDAADVETLDGAISGLGLVERVFRPILWYELLVLESFD